jgi:hypothetical protein
VDGLMWRAQIEGDPESLEILRKNFENHIIVEDNTYFLQCPQFGPGNEDLLQCAKYILNNMINLLNLNLNKQWKVSVQGTFQNYENGKKSIIMAPEPGIITLKGLPCSVTVNGTVSDPDVVNDNLEKFLRCIHPHENIQEALDFYKTPDWVNLFKVWELIEDDMGGKSEIVNKGWASSDEINLFRCTAHNREGAGLNARHAVASRMNSHCSQVLSSQDPMELSVGKSLIGRLLKQWIRFHCND